jgi:hypothetical protein
VEPDLRSSTSSDDGDRPRTPTPERFKRYSFKRTWPQPADLLYKEAKLAALEVEEFNLTRIYINDLNQLREQYERELAQLRLWSKDQLNQREEEEKKIIVLNVKMLYLFFSFLFLSLYLLILQKKQFWVKFFVLNKKNKHNKKKQTNKLK